MNSHRILDSISFHEPIFCVSLRSVEQGSTTSYELLCSSMSNHIPNLFSCYRLHDLNSPKCFTSPTSTISTTNENQQFSHLKSSLNESLTQVNQVTQVTQINQFNKSNSHEQIFETTIKFPLTDIEVLDPQHLFGTNNIICTTSDKLCLWSVDSTSTEELDEDTEIQQEEHLCLVDSLSLNKINCPLTSVCSSGSELIVSSTDCTVCLIDLLTFCVKTRLLAHEQPVYDTCFVNRSDPHIFLTCGFDGSVREFDSRNISSLSVVYQTSSPVVRICSHPHNSHIFCSLSHNSEHLCFHDLRNPGTPIGVTRDNHSFLSSFVWFNSTNKVTSSSSSQSPIIYYSNERGQIMTSEINFENVLFESSVIYEDNFPIESLSLLDDILCYSSNNTVNILHV